MFASYLLLKVCILILPELDAPLSVERPSFDGLEVLLVLGAPETVTIKLGGDTGPFRCGALLDLFVESFFGAILGCLLAALSACPELGMGRRSINRDPSLYLRPSLST